MVSVESLLEPTANLVPLFSMRVPADSFVWGGLNVMRESQPVVPAACLILG